MNRKWIGLAVAAVVALALMHTSKAQGTTLARLTLGEMAQRADAIVHAHCVSAESRWDGGTIWTFTAFDVIDTLKGAVPARVVVRLPGGRVGHIEARVEAAPRFAPGEEGFLFLERTGTGEYSVTAWSEGTFRIQRGLRSGGNDTVTQDSSTFPVFDTRERRYRSEGVSRMPVSQFRERLAAAASGASSGGGSR